MSTPYSRFVFAVLAFSLFLITAPVWNPLQAVNAQDTYVVNSTGDASDASPGDGVCATGSGQCTLRAAIEESNDDDDEDTVEFGDIPTIGGVAVISPDSSLVVYQQIVINGRLAPGYTDGGPPVVVLDGSNSAYSYDDGIHLDGFTTLFDGSDASSSIIVGLGIVNFPDNGIEIAGPDDVVIDRCYIGVGVDGLTPKPNGGDGIKLGYRSQYSIIVDSSNVSRIGGAGNVISGNDGDGIFVNLGNDNSIGGNLIGVSAEGATAVPNGGYGVNVGAGKSNSVGYALTVMGTKLYFENTISGNGGGGIRLSSSSNTVIANRVGTSADGAQALANERAGIEIAGNRNVIGGADAGARNVISGNELYGIIFGSISNGISADSNIVRGNYIGVSGDGESAVGNVNGIVFELSSDNEIENNVISGNSQDGVYIWDGSLRNVISDNYIGTNDYSGSQDSPLDLGNTGSGIYVTSSASTADDANIISGNSIGFNGDGVDVQSNYTKVQDNAIGADQNGRTMGNRFHGITVKGDHVSLFGNVIGNNARNGIYIDSGSENTITANYIGSDGQRNFGNGRSGIHIEGQASAPATDNLVGSTIESAANIIANHHGTAAAVGAGITVGEAGGLSDLRNTIGINKIYGNEIGVDLGHDGRTTNDFGDSDSGPNRLINYAEFEASATIYDESTGNVQVRYAVNCNSTSCTYPLRVDFYVMDKSGQHAVAWPKYLDTDDYPASSATEFRNASLTPPSGGQDPFVTQQDSLIVIVTDADGNSSEFSPAVSLGPPNQVPVASDDDVTVAFETSANLEVLANDSDPDGDALTITGTSAPTHGDVTNYDTSIEYTPNESYSGSDSFTYTIRDGSGGTDQATVNVSVSEKPNGAPVVSQEFDDETVDVDDDPLTYTLTSNFSDPDSDDLTYSVTSSDEAAATASISADELTVTAVAVGEATITVTADDGNGGSIDDGFVVTVVDNVATDSPEELPDVVTLYQNAPNPFARATTLRYALPEPQHVRLAVYDLLGRRVALLVNEKQGAGVKSVQFQASAGMSSGVYYLRLRAGDVVDVRKMLVTK